MFGMRIFIRYPKDTESCRSRQRFFAVQNLMPRRPEAKPSVNAAQGRGDGYIFAAQRAAAATAAEMSGSVKLFKRLQGPCEAFQQKRARPSIDSHVLAGLG
jgi:hypothetical protein